MHAVTFTSQTKERCEKEKEKKKEKYFLVNRVHR